MVHTGVSSDLQCAECVSGTPGGPQLCVRDSSKNNNTEDYIAGILSIIGSV